MPSPPPTLSERHARLFFGAALFCVTVTTFCQLGGIAANQALCRHGQNGMPDSMDDWTDGYKIFVFTTKEVKPWTCKWFQATQWWTIALQLLFWMSACMAWACGTLERSQAAIYGLGAVSSALSVASALYMMGEAAYYKKEDVTYTNGLVAFYGFFLGSIFNGILAFAGCELIHSRKQASHTSLDRQNSDTGTPKDGSGYVAV